MNQKLTLNPVAESSDDVVPSDDAVRQALLRMGSGKPRTGNAGGGHAQHHGGGQRRGGEQVQAASASPDARRRRFSQNEHVPVEYVSRDRQNGRHEPMRLDAGRAEAGEASDDRTGFLERELERERQARQAAERGLEEARTALTAARTRIAHLEIDIGEVRAQRQAMLDLAQQSAAQQSAAQQSAAQQSADARAAAATSVPSDGSAGGAGGGAGDGPGDGADDLFAPAAVRRGRGRPRRVPAGLAADAEPEPVKWWSDD